MSGKRTRRIQPAIEAEFTAGLERVPIKLPWKPLLAERQQMIAKRVDAHVHGRLQPVAGPVETAAAKGSSKRTKQESAGLAFLDELRALDVTVPEANTLSTEPHATNHAVAVQPVLIAKVFRTKPCRSVQKVETADKRGNLSFDAIKGEVMLRKFNGKS